MVISLLVVACAASHAGDESDLVDAFRGEDDASHGEDDARIADAGTPDIDACNPWRAEGRSSFVMTDSLGWSLTFTIDDACPPHLFTHTDEPFPFTCDEAGLRETISFLSRGRLQILVGGCSDAAREVWARAVVCESDADCTPMIDVLNVLSDPPLVPERTACVHGLCQYPDQPMDDWDYYALCQHDQPRWPLWSTARSDASEWEALRDEAIVACWTTDTECDVPMDCRQP